MLALGTVLLYHATAILTVTPSVSMSSGFARDNFHESCLLSLNKVPRDKYFCHGMTRLLLHWLASMFMLLIISLNITHLCMKHTDHLLIVTGSLYRRLVMDLLNLTWRLFWLVLGMVKDSWFIDVDGSTDYFWDDCVSCCQVPSIGSKHGNQDLERRSVSPHMCHVLILMERFQQPFIIFQGAPMIVR